MEIGRAPWSGNSQILLIDVKKGDSDLDTEWMKDDGTIVRIRVCMGDKSLILDM